MDNQKKVLRLFEYIRQVCALKNPLARDIASEEWTLFLDELPIDPKRIHTAGGADGDDMVLEVEKPEFAPCPELPFDLLGWVRTPNWRHFAVQDIEVREERLRHDERLGDVTERFVDSGVRIAAFEDWKRRRTLWRAGEQVKSRTQELFMRLYELYDRLRQAGDRLELLVGAGFFFSGLEKGINHPIILRRAELAYDPAGKMRVTLAPYPTELYSDLFKDMGGIEPDGIRAFADRLDEAELSPISPDLTDFLTRELGALSPNVRFAAKKFDLLPTDWYIVYPRQVLFVRRKNAGLEPAIAALAAYVDAHGEVPEALLSIVGAEQAAMAADPTITLADIRGEAADILLTKPANAEQLAIARKIESSPAVVVQGPPGTGKTHTIANLLGHFLARGQHVLVTSASTKALAVLKDKLPAGIQNLCVSLSGGTRDMEASVRGICEMLGRSSADEMRVAADRLAEERTALLTELAELRARVETISSLEARRDYFVLGGSAWSLSRMAGYLHEHEELAGTLPTPIVRGAELPLAEAEIAELYATNEVFTPAMLKEMAETLPNRAAMLTPARARLELAAAVTSEQERTGILTQLGAELDSDGRAILGGRLVVGELSLPLLAEAAALYARIDLKKLAATWARETVLAGSLGGAHREVYEILGRDIARVQQLKKQAMTQFFGHNIDYTLDLALDQNLVQTLAEIAEAFDASGDGRLSWWTRIRHKDWVAVTQGFAIDGHPLTSRRDCQLAMQYVTLRTAREEVRCKWAQLLEPLGMVSYDELGRTGDDIDDLTSARYEEIAMLLDWYQTVWAELRLALKRAGVAVDVIYPARDFLTPHQALETELAWLGRDLPAWLRLIELTECEQVDTLESTRAAIAAGSGTVADALAVAVAEGDAEAYSAAYEKLTVYEGLQNVFHRREELLARLGAAAPAWAERIRRQEGREGEIVSPESISAAWLYESFKAELAAVPQEDMRSITREIDAVSLRLREVTTELAEKLAWYNLMREVAGTSLQASLVGWSKATVKLGRGKGKYAARHLREARECMLDAQRAVPAWIMPLTQVWQNLKPESEKFDIILIDEASQADITALPLLYFGKKIIIVGDDKQVSPSAIGVTAEDIQRLQSATIEGAVDHAALFTMDTSLYDVAQLSFAARMLTEHFRCVPEIIGYSNALAYDGRIRPLREAGGALSPLVAIEVAGSRDSRKRNYVEAETIVATLAACLEQPEYSKATFGAISLLGDEQARLIRELAATRLGIGVLEEHELLVGTPGAFQGDERDVVFLSLVDSSEDGAPLRLTTEGHAGDTAKRYNVAVSRARDQLWVVHSMALSQLKSGDIRRGLLEYVAMPHSGADSGTDGDASSLELAVARALTRAGYAVTQHYLVGAYSLDLVVEGGGQRVAIVCDGERWSLSAADAAETLARQATLERLGWRFIRVRGSHWYRSPALALQAITQELTERGIEPGESTSAAPAAEREELTAAIRARAAAIIASWHSEDSEE